MNLLRSLFTPPSSRSWQQHSPTTPSPPNIPQTNQQLAFFTNEARKIQVVGQVSDAIMSKQLVRARDIFFTLAPASTAPDATNSEQLQFCYKNFFDRISSLPRAPEVTKIAFHIFEGTHIVPQVRIALHECLIFLSKKPTEKYRIYIATANSEAGFIHVQSEIDKLKPNYKTAIETVADFSHNIIDVRSKTSLITLLTDAETAYTQCDVHKQIDLEHPQSATQDDPEQMLYDMVFDIVEAEIRHNVTQIDEQIKDEMVKIITTHCLTRPQVQEILNAIDEAAKKTNKSTRSLFTLSALLLSVAKPGLPCGRLL